MVALIALLSLVLTGGGMAWVLGFWDPQLLAQNMVGGIDSFPLLAVPFFILAGELMNAGGLSRRIIDLARAYVGHIRGGLGYVAIGAAVVWSFMSFYTVDEGERSVELLFGRPYAIGTPGLNFAPWPAVTKEIVQATGERVTEIGLGQGGPMDSGLMLTRDQNIVDMGYQIVWNVSDPEQYLFNLADPPGTIRAVAESAMRDIVARSELAPILNRDREAIRAELQDAVQRTLNLYEAGINVVRVNLDRADPPREVIDSFREVQAAQQERDRLEKEADAYANKATAGARGQAQCRFVGRTVRHHAVAAAQPIGQGGVVVVTAQGRVAPGGHHFKHPLRQAQDGDVERAAAQVVHGVHALGSVVQAVGDGGGRGFVDQAQHLQARQLGGVFRGLALGIVKVGGHGDDGAVNQSAQAVFGTLAQAGQNFGADFHGAFHPGSSGQGHHAGGGDKFVGQVRGFVRQVAHAAAHEAFGRGDGVARVQRARGCSVVADVARAVFQIAHHRGQQHAAFGVGQAARHTTLHGSHQGVRGAQVNADGQAPLVRGGGLTGLRNLQKRHGVRGSLGVWGRKGRRWTGGRARQGVS